MKVGVLVSGAGTNLQALLDAEARGALAPAEICVVVSNKHEAPALLRAEVAGVPGESVEHPGLERQVFEVRLIEVLDDYDDTQNVYTDAILTEEMAAE